MRVHFTREANEAQMQCKREANEVQMRPKHVLPFLACRFAIHVRAIMHQHRLVPEAIAAP